MRRITITPNDVRTDKALAWLANELALAWAHDRIPRDGIRPLPDLWFSLFPEVPVPSEKTYCAPKSNGSLNVIISRMLKTFWSAGIEQLRSRELCGDLIVSGHTISLFMVALALKQYCPKKLYCLAQLCYCATFIAVPCILLARKHYTIDVHCYHQGDFDQIPLKQSIWAFMVPYLEEDAPPPQYFQNRWKWPSNCQQYFRKRLL
ncbi:unnamed protein product [Acanthocheilonema viteae]|uniref:Sphingomyelin synthase-like domain-containing protein n=1 Tax=Acanthocheilonema viteae TaxID=6277 RepID=A0A498SR01_ACAVI|nr:unnamed protein product [Acanthocheilonema viteae]